MRTRLDVDAYQEATDQQRAEVDAYLAALDRSNAHHGIVAVEATAEGTIRVERHVGRGPDAHPWGWLFTVNGCPRCGRWQLGYLEVRETLRPALPPPWLAWPDPTEEDPDAC